jgi:hypothetical protein
MRWVSTRQVVAALLVTIVAGLAAWLVHRETLGYGFHYDDYHTIRPYTRSEILATFHGTWDAHGDVMAPFYRPLRRCSELCC